MADDLVMTYSLAVVKNSSLPHRSNGTVRRSMVSTLAAPHPGALTIPVTGRIVEFPFFGDLGVAEAKNFDLANSYEVGIYDPQTNTFYPLLEIGPGESWPMPLSRNLLEQYNDTGTGTTGPENKLMLKAITAAVEGYFGAFPR